MKLYFSPGTSSLAVHIVLREADVPFAPVRVDLQTKLTESGADFTRFNGKGSVPVLEFSDGQRLTEVTAIVQYVADQSPTTGLIPTQGLPRYRVLEWLSFVSSELHKSFVLLTDSELPQDVRRRVVDKISKRFDWITPQLKGRNEYLIGREFTAADAYLFTILNWPPLFKLDLSPWPALTHYAGRIAERPKVRDALRAEGLIQ